MLINNNAGNIVKCKKRKKVISRGHMPESSASQLLNLRNTMSDEYLPFTKLQNKLPPHEASLLNFTNEQIIDILA